MAGELGMLLLIMSVSLGVLNLGYGFEGSFTRLRDFKFVSDLLTGTKLDFLSSQGEGIPSSAANSNSALFKPRSLNRFTYTRLADLPVPLPRNYLLGIDIQQRDFEHYGRPSYLGGTWCDHGWWYYYLYACAIKLPLGLSLLGLFAICYRCFGKVSDLGCARLRRNCGLRYGPIEGARRKTGDQ